jgi:hypothetical protein
MNNQSEPVVIVESRHVQRLPPALLKRAIRGNCRFADLSSQNPNKLARLGPRRSRLFVIHR